MKIALDHGSLMRGISPEAVLEAYLKMLNPVSLCSTITNVWSQIQMSRWWEVDHLALHSIRLCRIRLAKYPPVF